MSDIEFKISFEGNEVYLRNPENKNDWFKVTNYGLEKDLHDGSYIDEDDISFDEKVNRKTKKTYYLVNTIFIGDKKYQYRRPHSTNHQNRDTAQQKSATAPFNFVPLNQTVLKETSKWNHSQYLHLSGYVDYDIDNLSPLFIRELSEKPQFFGKYLDLERIPGSTLRGMIKSLYEIITYSKIGEIEGKRRFFNRNVGSDDSRYKERILDKQKAGWIKRVGRKFLLTEAEDVVKGKSYISVAVMSKATKKDNTFKSKLRNRGELIISHDPTKIKLNSYSWKDIYLKIQGTIPTDYSIKEKEGYKKGVLFQTGEIFSKKHEYFIGNPMKKEGDNYKDVTKSFDLYFTDDSRSDRYKLVDKLKKNQNKWFPCFYIEEEFENEKQILFGGTKMFRLPYEKKVNDFLPTSHQADQKDMTIDVFGTTEKSTKIFFEDALSVEKVEYHNVSGIKMLASPKPTSYAQYAKDGKSYDEDTQIKGHKLYWHNKDGDYTLDIDKVDRNKQKQYPKKIEAVKKAKFRGRIRFENLTEEQLGALMIIMNLNNQYALKIGMGKPYGMGSVQISNASLTIINRNDRYKQLFGHDTFHTGAKINQASEYIHKFIDKIKTVDSSIESYEKLFLKGRMKELASMLTFDSKTPDWGKKIRYMDLNEFKKRPKLKSPSQTIK